MTVAAGRARPLQSIDLVRRRLLLASLVLSSLDCTTMPQPPVVLGADRQALSVGGVSGTQIVPTRAVASVPKGRPVVLRTRLDGNKTGATVFPLEPRLAFVHRAADRIEWTGHVGWLTNGLGLRYLPGGAEVPVVLAAGAQVSTPLAAWGSGPLTWDAQVQASVHPGTGTWRAMLGAGLSQGRRQHVLEVPEGPLAHYGIDQQTPVELVIAREETRIEGLVGVSLHRGRTTVALAGQPFYTLASGRAEVADCWTGCADGLRLDSFEARWGAAVTATVYVGL